MSELPRLLGDLHLLAEPTSRSDLEDLLGRLFLAVMVERCVTQKHRFPRDQPHPHGIARFVDLSFLSRPRVFQALWIGLVLALALYVTGVVPVVGLAYTFLLAVGVFTLTQSQGGIYHNTHVVSLVVLGQLVAHLRCLFFPPAPLTWDAADLAWNYSLQAVAAVYVLAGISKLVRSGGSWFRDAHLLATDVVKSNDQHYYDRPRSPELLAKGMRLGTWMLRHPHLTRGSFAIGLLAELFAFVALTGRAAGVVIGLVLLGMHRMIFETMYIRFTYYAGVLIVFFVDTPHWLARLIAATTGWSGAWS